MNNEAYSHKAGATTCKLMGWCTAPGLIIHVGHAFGGRGGEIKYLRRFVPDLGHVTASLTDPGTPEGERITIHFDGGPQVSGEVLAGADVLMPHRRPPKGELTKEELDYNLWRAGERAIIENNFADIKAHRILGNVFRGSVTDLKEAFSVVSGLVNLKRIMRDVRRWTPDTHRKSLKPGRKTPGPPQAPEDIRTERVGRRIRAAGRKRAGSCSRGPAQLGFGQLCAPETHAPRNFMFCFRVLRT